MIQEYNILVIENNKEELNSLKSIISDKYNIIQTNDEESAFKILNKKPDKISAIIIDLVNRKMDSYKFLKDFREKSESTTIPVITITEKDDRETELEALRLGAYDFIFKPYFPEILNLRLENVLLKSQYTSLRELRYLYEYDSLTEIYNKNKFFYKSHEMLMKNPDTKFTILKFDICRFHLINLYAGIETGNEILIKIAKKLRTYLSEKFSMYTCGRIDKDIFSYCIPTDKKSVIEQTIKEISDFLGDYNILFNIKITCGIYIIEENNSDMVNIYDKVNLASKGCKNSYTRYFKYYKKSMAEKVREEQEIINDMEKAILNREFEVWYQPKYDVIENTPIGGEALVRWRHPTKGLISPSKFIPLFESNGFITTLDYYVWDQVCRDLSKWIKEGKRLPISINVSRVNLLDQNIIEKINNLTEKYNIPRELLNIEITESTYSQNPDMLIDIVDQLRKNGYLIYMDDFGSGYSSLSLLKDMQVDVLKIDMQFFEKGALEIKSKNILASIIKMAKLLNMSVVAEGVELEEQVKFLRAWGCEYIQGYYFARPMMIEDYEIYLKNNCENFTKSKVDQPSMIFNEKMNIYNISKAICILELKNDSIHIVQTNQPFLDLFNYEYVEELVPKNLSEISDEDIIKLKVARDELLKTKKSSSTRITINTKTGKSLWLQLNFDYAYRVSDSNIIYVIFDDLTDLRDKCL